MIAAIMSAHFTALAQCFRRQHGLMEAGTYLVIGLWACLSLSGCQRDSSRLAQRIAGTWSVNMEKTEPFLQEYFKKEKPPSAVDLASTETAMSSYRSSMQVRRLIIGEARFERWTGEEVHKSSYEVLEGGEDYVLIRYYPDDAPRYNEMTLEEISNRFNGNKKGVPTCLGIRFLDEDHFRIFVLNIENGKMTHGQPFPEVYERIADLTP